MFTLIKLGRVQNRVMLGQKLGQTLEKPCLRSRGHIFSPITIKLGQRVCLYEIWVGFEIGHVNQNLGH